jgi:hypothetical protein
MNDANLDDWLTTYRAMPRVWLLKPNNQPWEVVTKAEWIQRERNAGFYPTYGGSQDEPATGSFSSSIQGQGRYVEIELFSPESYDWDPEFRDTVIAEIERLSNGT